MAANQHRHRNHHRNGSNAAPRSSSSCQQSQQQQQHRRTPQEQQQHQMETFGESMGMAIHAAQNYHKLYNDNNCFHPRYGADFRFVWMLVDPSLQGRIQYPECNAFAAEMIRRGWKDWKPSLRERILWVELREYQGHIDLVSFAEISENVGRLHVAARATATQQNVDGFNERFTAAITTAQRHFRHHTKKSFAKQYVSLFQRVWCSLDPHLTCKISPLRAEVFTDAMIDAGWSDWAAVDRERAMWAHLQQLQGYITLEQFAECSENVDFQLPFFPVNAAVATGVANVSAARQIPEVSQEAGSGSHDQRRPRGGGRGERHRHRSQSRDVAHIQRSTQALIISLSSPTNNRSSSSNVVDADTTTTIATATATAGTTTATTAIASSSSSSIPDASSNNNNKTEGDAMECSVCMSGARCIVLLPCAHLCLCEDCLNDPLLDKKTCPMCRASVSQFIKIFT